MLFARITKAIFLAAFFSTPSIILQGCDDYKKKGQDEIKELEQKVIQKFPKMTRDILKQDYEQFEKDKDQVVAVLEERVRVTPSPQLSQEYQDLMNAVKTVDSYKAYLNFFHEKAARLSKARPVGGGIGLPRWWVQLGDIDYHGRVGFE